MKKFRNNVFETNSSSTHSITIGKNCLLDDTIEVNGDGEIILYGGEFGWGIEEYNDALIKANYCAIDQQDNDENIEMLIRVIKNFTSCKNVIIEIDYNSYIDHQSYGTSDKAFESDETLTEFLFSSNSYLYTDNDNY